MQGKEFDNLMKGKTANWAPLSQEQIASGKENNNLKEVVKQNEQPVDPLIITQVKNLVEAERKKGTRERTIRRMVKSKFNILIAR